MKDTEETTSNIDNQQPSLITDIDLGWLCGLIDGEGCLGIYHRGGQRKKDYKPELRIDMTSKEDIQRYVTLMDRLDAGAHIKYYLGDRAKNRRGHWVVSIGGLRRLKRILPLFIPHLVGKKEKAQLVYNFCESRLSHAPNGGYTVEEEKLLEIASSMNKRGWVEEGSTTILRE